ncbi:zinc-finger homeodomain protein 5 [Argentina anserina]|uniref:zinc-finger homeodomain protein 5 n=1 Tax=Argentina anserina TaxID=57926 RepID=UPI0021765CA9|nr:zinc-finger homeodomain protein 5 [Potentilla anserina]
MRTSGSAALSYGGTHLTKESSGGGDKRRLGNIHNGTPTAISAFTATHQTLDHHHHHPLQPLHVQPVQLPAGDLDPDRVVGSTAVAPTSGGHKSKTPTSAPTTGNVRYRECLKNHAANIGGNVFDGCGEFMPCGEEGTLEALKCAACDCHRNFHRKEVDGETTPFGPGSRSRSIMLSPLQLPPPLPSPSSALHHHRHQKFSMVQPMSMAFGGGTESSSEDLNIYDNVDGIGGGSAPPFSLSKKRFRTKFTAEQKVRMVEFAERVGWRIQKQDEDEVERFCDEVGVKRQVLRVWMHNNKNTVKKMQHDHHDITTTTSQLALENVEAHEEAGQGEGRTDT